jgi:hypothetical protein
MYSRQCFEEGGFRASAGSWYFRTTAPADVVIVLVAAARRPEGRKFGFCFSGTGEEVPSSFVDLKAAFWDGSGPLRLYGSGGGDDDFPRRGE